MSKVRANCVEVEVYWEFVDKLCLNAYREVWGYSLSRKETHLPLIWPDEFECADCAKKLINPNEPSLTLMHVVEDETGGAHIEPYWATPWCRKLPEGYRWRNGGALAIIGKRTEQAARQRGTYVNEVVCLPIYDEIETVEGKEADALRIEIEQMWNECWFPDWPPEITDDKGDELPY